jgi:hypothetical protein
MLSRLEPDFPSPGLRLEIVLEIFFTGVLVLTTLAAGWFAVYVVYRLFKGQA